ncbi:MAG TPA: hypothetical protein VJV23_04800 [Candidatus Polarisedimenticolia bacterium]|nr:hypothetical protein [Candidatus Polarisedimenticolia bacterium]
MRRWGAILIVGLTAALGGASARAEGHVRLLGGLRELAGGVWDPVEEQGLQGIEAAFSLGSSPWRLTAGLSRSEDKKHTLTPAPVFTVTFEGKSSELSVGLARLWRAAARLRPYAGGGLSLGTASFTASDNDFAGGRIEDRDQFAALYGAGGLLWFFDDHLHVGAELRLSGGSRIGLLEGGGRANGSSAALSVGWGW